MTQQTADPIQVYETATKRARSIIAGVKPDQMSSPTPCAEWDVTALLNHLVGAQTNIAGTVSGSQVAAGNTSLDTFDAAVSKMLEAVRAPGGLDKLVQGRQGEVPARERLSGACMDMTIHTWDLAKATGQDTSLDPAVVEFVMPIAQGIAGRGPGPAFAAPVEAGADASLQDKMISLTGRKP